jgi:hypothetical protein
VDELDNYLTSLLIGTTFSQIFQEAGKALQNLTGGDPLVEAAAAASWPRSISQCLQQALGTLIQSASWQASLVQGVTLLAHHGTSAACFTTGLQVVPHHHQHQPQHSKIIILSWKWRLLLLACLRHLLPQLYRAWKERHLQNMTAVPTEEHDDEEEESVENREDKNVAERERRQRALQRRRQVWTKIFQAVDTVIPMLRLGLLLNLWKSAAAYTNTTATTTKMPFTSSLTMALLGLGYAATSTDPITATRSNNVQNFFVLYAHRRWVHQELLPLWQMLGSPVASSIAETYRLVRQLILGSAALQHWNRIRQQRQRIMVKTSSETQNSCNDAQQRTGACIICGMDKMTLPYRIESCGHVGCYTCLWEYARQNINGGQKISKMQRHGGHAKTVRCPVCYSSIHKCLPL